MNNPSPTPLDNQIRELAAGLRDVIAETDEGYLERSPAEAVEDMAARLLLRLSKSLTVLSLSQAAALRIRAERAEAAERILTILTGWLNEHPERHCVTGFDPLCKNKFEIIMRESGETRAFFQGVSVQDAYGQAAQTIGINGGEL
jgi:hypothetical protein